MSQDNGITTKYIRWIQSALPSFGTQDEIRFNSADQSLYYWDDTAVAWVQMSGGGSGGGAGSPVEFYTLDGFSTPTQSTLGLAQTYEFSENGGEYIFLDFVVPAGYEAGAQLKLKGGLCAADSTDTSKDLLLVAHTLAVAPGDPIPTTISGGHASVNTEVAVIANANFAIQLSDIDLCGVTGEVNGAPLVPGETKLIIAVYRDISNETDSFQGNLKLIKNTFYLSLGD